MATTSRRKELFEALLRLRRAQRKQPVSRDLALVEDVLVEPDGDPHDRATRRALAYHRALARSLRRADVDVARRTLWARAGRPAVRRAVE